MKRLVFITQRVDPDDPILADEIGDEGDRLTAMTLVTEHRV